MHDLTCKVETKKVASLIGLVMRRIEIASEDKRFHLTLKECRLLTEPCTGSPSTTVPPGTEVMVLKWHIPNIEAVNNTSDDIKVYDHMLVLKSRQIGFIPRTTYYQSILV